MLRAAGLGKLDNPYYIVRQGEINKMVAMSPKNRCVGSWKENEVAGYDVFSQFLMGYLMDYGCFPS